VATCALNPGQSLTVSTNGVTESLPGHIGLAPEWLDQSCGPSCRRWVSACLLAHANAFGNRVEISLRGDHPALQPSDYARENFTLEEAGFYGDVFQPAEEAIEMYACFGSALPELIGGDILSGALDLQEYQDYISGRLCGTLGTIACGVVQQGPCFAPLIGACNTFGQTGGYHGCYASDDQALFDEVITVYLRR
jgi:hypothetical protein